ncbi:uncharacterized protein G2W53_005406 [Senna tora]|uniref:Uncharacterized protein n=1 Tax=Senna tora TaxID=362788 RepID=A0A835CBL8_9FABA|nr:uncharacterized protein G2W53_005406 [Senna tora]
MAVHRQVLQGPWSKARSYNTPLPLLTPSPSSSKPS